MLEDLNLLEKPLIEKINRFNVLNCELPEHFTSSVKCIFKDTIEYGRYCSCITSSSGLRIFISNNWFYIAAILAPLYKPLFEYKSLIDEIVPADILKNKNEDIIIQNINNSKFSNEEKELLIKFATDYNWWNGGNGKSGKSLDRGDWHNSAILALAKVVNVSQSYICVLWEFLGQKPDYVKLLDDKINFYIENGDPLKVKETRNTNAGTLLPLQQIFYGAPGTGKSHKVKEVTETLPKSDVFRTTFHPDYDYASFVGCYKPTKEDDKITYFFIPQVFTKAYIEAWKIIAKDEKVTVKVKKEDGTETEQETLKPVYLVIEEINRGNCAQIFGDLFQLLDRNENGYSEYPIDIDEDLKNYLVQELGADSEGIKDGKLCLPPNLNLLATMNTSDQSLFPMDSAFKRRWDWEFVPIRYSADEAKNDKDNFHTFTITIGDKDKGNVSTYLWTDFLKNVNAKILSVTDSEDKQMGEYFIKKSVDQKTFINKVMYYLWSEVGKDMFGSTKPFFELPEKTEDGKDAEKKQFSFNELFKGNAIELLQGFMKKLEVKSEEEKAAEKAATTAPTAE